MRAKPRWRNPLAALGLAGAACVIQTSVQAAETLPAAVPPGTDESRVLAKDPKGKPIAPVLKTFRILGRQLDTRQIVDRPLWKQLPFSAIGIIVVEFAGGRYFQGTGFLVAPNVVLTAAHVLHSPDFGLALKASFKAACEPDAEASQLENSRLRVSKAWRSGDFDISADYGAMFLPDAKTFAACGVLEIESVMPSFLNRQARDAPTSFMVAGFPVSKPADTMWQAAGSVAFSPPASVRHLIDTTPGQSGAPLLTAIIDQTTAKRAPLAIGIHSRGNESLNVNEARRIDADVVNDLRIWWQEIVGKEFVARNGGAP